jgi:hypothetical protein
VEILVAVHKEKRMYIERVVNTDGVVHFVDAKGRKYPEIYCFVDDKRVAVDIVRADTTEGWVDVEMPEIESEENVVADGTIDISKAPAAFFKTSIKRLTGKVKIMAPT